MCVRVCQCQERVCTLPACIPHVTCALEKVGFALGFCCCCCFSFPSSSSSSSSSYSQVLYQRL